MRNAFSSANDYDRYTYIGVTYSLSHMIMIMIKASRKSMPTSQAGSLPIPCGVCVTCPSCCALGRGVWWVVMVWWAQRAASSVWCLVDLVVWFGERIGWSRRMFKSRRMCVLARSPILGWNDLATLPPERNNTREHIPPAFINPRCEGVRRLRR